MKRIEQVTVLLSGPVFARISIIGLDDWSGGGKASEVYEVYLNKSYSSFSILTAQALYSAVSVTGSKAGFVSQLAHASLK